MDETERVLERLRRIRELTERDAPADALLDELRRLVAEAEAWARVEGDARARQAVADLAATMPGSGEVVPLALVRE
jgi:hypothetical protein